MSDSDSVDSDDGVKFKTEDVRNRHEETNCRDSNIRRDKMNKESRKSTNSSPVSSVSIVQASNLNERLDMNKVIGPALPAGYIKKEENSTKAASNLGTIGPALPYMYNESIPKTSPCRAHSESTLIGPQLPPHMLSKSQESFSSSISEQNDTLTSKYNSTGARQLDIRVDSHSVEPQLPSNELNKSEINNAKRDRKSIGPSLPAHLRKKLQEEAEKDVQGPLKDSDDDQDMYGPLPAGISKHSAAEVALEERALQLQINRLNPQEKDETVRESWMVELPEIKAVHLGLGPRQFRNRAGPDMSDRSSWTEISSEKGPQKNKEKKVDLKTELELRQLQKRDREQELLIKKHKRKSKSLVDMHQKKLRKKDEVAGPSERIPFSRETDLQVNRFDDAQKKAIMKKAELLDDRFSSGKSKFL